MNRRRLLQATGGVLAASAGCVGLGSVFGGGDLPTIDESGDGTGTVTIDPGDDAVSGEAAAVWSQRAADAANTSAVLGADGPGDDPVVVWEVLADREIRHWPVVDSEHLYVLAGRGVDARSIADGSQAWGQPIPWRRGQPAVHDGIAVLPAEDTQRRHQLVGLDAATGEQLWSHSDHVRLPVGGVSPHSGVTVADGALYFATETGVLSLETRTGDLRWFQPIDERPTATTGGLTANDNFTPPDWTLPAVAGDRVVVFDEARSPDRRPRVHALDRTTGEPDWTTTLDTSTEWSLAGYPVAGGDEVFVRAENPEFVALANDSEEDDDRGDSDRIYALDVATGEPAWRWDLPGAPVGSPAYASGALFCWSSTAEPLQYRLHAVDVADRSVAWTYTTEADNLGRPIVTSDAVYFVHDTDIVALSVADGSPDWSVSVGEGLFSPGLVVADDAIYAMAAPVDPERAASDDERVVAVR